MKTKPSPGFIATALHIAVAALFFLFFVYMGLFENVSVYQARPHHTSEAVTDYSVETVTDDTAPAGVRTVYRWKLTADTHTEKCLCFYIVHHCADVYYDDELIYSLSGDANNRIGNSISSNWVTVPIYLEDDGKEVTVILTPLFGSVIDFTPEFLTGSHFTIVFDQLKQDFPQLFLSTLCILLGLFIVIVHLHLYFRTGARPWGMCYLGSFSVMLGVWRIVDTKSSPLLFAGNSMVLGYITIGTLFLFSVPLGMFIGTLFIDKKRTPMTVLSVISTLIALVVLVLQVLGVAEFKELLVLSHIMLIITICIAPLLHMIDKRQKPARISNSSRKYFLLLAIGIFLDMISFYITKSSSDIFFTLITFLLYAVITFADNTLDATRKAYTDPRTGLVNKIRWNELLSDETALSDAIGMIMFDMNGLKQVNDKLGHEAGDLMIFDFSNILRNALPVESVICRWGGDEFTVMVPGADTERLQQLLNTVRIAVEDYNATHFDPHIFYAVGYAASAEFPDKSRKELLAVADGRMYQNKQAWYSEDRAN